MATKGASNVTITNRSKSITTFQGFFDVNGRELVLGTPMDEGIEGAPQPTAVVTKATFDKMMESRIYQAMFGGAQSDFSHHSGSPIILA